MGRIGTCFLNPFVRVLKQPHLSVFASEHLVCCFVEAAVELVGVVHTVVICLDAVNSLHPEIVGYLMFFQILI